MNSLTQTDLQTYLRRLVEEHLPSKDITAKRSSQESAAPRNQTNRSNAPAKGEGDNR